jgi:hypothetical protein
MTVDERLREELSDAAKSGHLREDEAFESVRLKHRRGDVRRGITRQATAVAVALSLFASVALVVSWRNTPDRFRSTATIRVAPAGSANTTSTTTYLTLKYSDPRRLALASGTRRAVLVSAHRSPYDTSIEFRANYNSGRDLLSLVATAPSANESTAVTRKWVSVFDKVRRADAIRAERALNRAFNRRVKALHRRLVVIDANLKTIDPAYYDNSRYFRYNAPNGFPPAAPEPGPTKIRPGATVRELNLLNERALIVAQLADLGAEAASSGPQPLATPSVVAKPIAPAVRVDTSSPATVPVLITWVIGLLAVLAGAVFVYRRRTRAMRQVSA